MPGSLVKPKNQIFVKGYGFLSFAKTMSTSIGGLTGNKIVNKLTKVSTTSPQNNSGTATNETEMFDLIEKYQKKDICLQKKDKKISNVLILL